MKVQNILKGGKICCIGQFGFSFRYLPLFSGRNGIKEITIQKTLIKQPLVLPGTLQYELRTITTPTHSHQTPNEKKSTTFESNPVEFILLEKSNESSPLPLEEEKKIWFSDAKIDNIDALLKDYDYINEENNSAYLRGLKYEYDVLKFLKRFGFSLERTGRSRDRGIDFRGVWHLPDQSVPIIGQCKNEKKTLSSRYIREFIGTLNEEKHSVVGIFVSNSRFSKECRLTAAVDVPLLFCQLENNKLVGVYLNTAAQKRLPNLTITTQNDPHGQKTIYLMYFLKKP